MSVREHPTETLRLRAVAAEQGPLPHREVVPHRSVSGFRAWADAHLSTPSAPVEAAARPSESISPGAAAVTGIAAAPHRGHADCDEYLSYGKQGVCRGLPPAAGGPLPEKEEVDRCVLAGDRSSSGCRSSGSCSSLHLREAGKADQHWGGFAGAHLNVEAIAAVGVPLRQRSDEVGPGGQEKLKVPVRVGGDSAAGAREGIPGGRTLRKREARVRERAPGVAAGGSLAHWAWAAE